MTIARHPIAWALALVVLCALFMTSVTIVPETAQGVIVRMGQPVGTVNRFRPGADVIGGNAGLFAHVPFLEQVVLIDRRPRAFELQNQEIASNEPVRFVADAEVRFRVVDPTLMLRTVGDESQIATNLEPVVASALRIEAAGRPAAALYRPDELGLLPAVLKRVEPVARRIGVSVLSVRLERTDLPSGAPLDQALDRMRAQEHDTAMQIAAKGDSEATGVRAEADANAARIYADSYGKDPEFYDFYRAMQSYPKTLGQGTAVVLSPDSDYLKQFRGH